MIKKLTLCSMMLIFGFVSTSVHAEHPIFEQQKAIARRRMPENRKRVEAALAQANLPGDTLTWYTVPAISDVMRLPDAFPEDGIFRGEVRVVAARDEFAPASFLLYSRTGASGITLNVSNLTGPNKAVIPSESLDLKIVKVWFQNGNAWHSYFADVGLMLTPELLLRDENLIKVDTENSANYARLGGKDAPRHVWISPPRQIDSIYDEGPGYKTFETFRPLAEPSFTDAETIMPVKLEPGEFKQFWLTAHIPKNSAQGVYRGTIDLKSGGKSIGSIPVALRVLPFELPFPKTYFDFDRDFLVSFYGGPQIHLLQEANGGDRELAEKQLLSILKNMKRHNVFSPKISNYQAGEMLERHIELMKEAGLSTRPLVANTMPHLEHGGRPLNYPQLMRARQSADQWQRFYMDLLGHTDVYIQSGDENPPAWVAKMRPAWRYFHERDLKIYTAGHAGMFIKGGYIYDKHPTAGFPEEEEKSRRWNKVGHAYVSFYAGQHNGVENPAFVRRQHGLLSYLSNFSMICNYKFAMGPWNDLIYELYKPMMVAYPTYDGLVDTLAWEGFREAIDDIRYATLLIQRARTAIDSGELDKIYAGRKALQWFALLDGRTVDLNAARAEMIHMITELGEML